jgi:hypothetical protein
VIGVSLPRWTDDELLQELRAALQEAPVEASVISAAQAVFSWRTVDADLELLCLDAGAGLTAGAPVRGSGQGMLSFHGERLSVEIEIDEAGITGLLTPPQPAQVTLVTADGAQATTRADEVGCFTFPPPGHGPLRIECRLDADRFITEWVNI